MQPTPRPQYLSRGLAPDAHATATALYGLREADRLLPPTLERIATLGPACRITQRPAAAPEPRKPLELLSKNGKRLPLRAFDFHDLNREYWSQGKAVFGDSLERQQARELTAHETPIERMTLDQLIETADREPLSESRRAWLEWGRFDSHIAGRSMNGTVSLEGYADHEGSIGETLFGKGIDAIPADDIAADSLDTGDFFADEASSFGKGTAYTGLDPITQKQIDWEQEKYYTDQPMQVTLAPITREDGSAGWTIQTERKLAPDALMRVARSVKSTFISLAGNLDEVTGLEVLNDRVAQARDYLSALGGDPEFATRYTAPADDLWHSSYEEVHKMVAVLPGSECVRNFGGFCNFADCWCNTEGCTYTECHYHTRVARTVHRNARRNKDELWHRRLFDVTALELGTNDLVSPLAEAI